MATIAPMISIVDNRIAAVYAVDAKAKAKAQKEKEKAKAKAQKEKEKAKAQKEKEKAKAQKEKEKAAAQKQKEKAKAAAQKQKERDKAQAQKQNQKSQQPTKASSKPASQKAKPSLTAAEQKAQYYEQVAAIDEANAKAEAYNNRDIAHRLGIWGLIGYSNLFTSKIDYNQNAGTGFMNKDKGFVGGGFGLGYQLRYQQVIATTGLELAFYNSVMGISNNENGGLNRSFGMEPYADLMTYNYEFSQLQDKIIGGFIQIPLMAGMELKSLPLFWQAGLKVGLGILGQSTLSGVYSTTISDKELIDEMSNMYSHSLVTDQELKGETSQVKFGFNLAATAEIGVNLDQWLQSMARMRISLFADYGFLNSLNYKPASAAQDIPTQLPGNPDPLKFGTNSALVTTSAEKAIVNPFLVGAKVAVWFDLPRPQKPIQDYPKVPAPRMAVYTYDLASNEALSGVAVEIKNTESGKTMQKNTNREGLLQGNFTPGEYQVSATKNGYYPSDTLHQTIEVFDFDTLRLSLERIPAPIIYTLCLNIYDVETKAPLSASVRFTTTADTTVLYAAQSSDDGFIETPLREGDYIAHLSAMGYMSKDDTLHFVRDTLDVYMQHIKEGIKVKIDNLFFATNKTYILPQSEQAMSDLAQFLLDNPSVTIHITGHTDAVGSDEANQILSEGRANAVRKDLIKRGVAEERLTAEGKGEKEPVADNDTEEGRQLNRRVEFVITGTDGEDIEQVF